MFGIMHDGKSRYDRSSFPIGSTAVLSTASTRSPLGPPCGVLSLSGVT
jgi:hypothetical protein